MSKRPNLKPYKGEDFALKNIENAYASAVFGDSVFLPIGASDGAGAAKRTKKNLLEEEVKKMNI